MKRVLAFGVAVQTALLVAAALPAYAQAAGGKPLMVVLSPSVDKRAAGPDTTALGGLVQSEFASAAHGADVLLLEDAAAHAAVMDPSVLRCQDVTCAPRVGAAVKARYVVATQVTAVGKERVITVRLFDAGQNRLLGMQTEKTGFGEDDLPPVVARAALRLALAGKVDKVAEPPKPVAAPEPEPPPPAPVAPPVAKKDPPKSDGPNSQTIILVPQAPAPQPAPAPPPQNLDVPPAPIAGSQVTANPEVPDPNRLPAGVPVAPVDQGRRVGWGPRTGIILAGLLFGAWAPLAVPVAAVTAVILLLRAVEVRNTIRARPHDRDDIPGLVTRGRQFEIGAYVVLGAAAALLVYGVTVVSGSIITAVVLP